MLKPNETYLIRRKRISKNNVANSENYTLRKMGFKSRKIEYCMYFVINFKFFWS